MSTLISGSIAYDYIMTFPDSFKNHILPDQIHILNVCFVVNRLERNFGGTAGNIAYTTKLLGGSPVVFGALGTDAKDYASWFEKHGIDTKYIVQSKDKLTTSAHITTDKEDNQVAAYHPGPDEESLSLSVKDAEGVELAIIAPTQKDVMINHALQCYDEKIPFCFDPGQQITALSPQELMGAIGQAKFLIGNDYEMRLIQEKTGWDAKELLNHVEVLITTLGEKGSVITSKLGILEIAPCPPQSIEDPTGAGDAYRAGFFWAYTKGLEYKVCGQVASVCASYAIEHYGTQNHSFTMEEFGERYEKTYSEGIF